MSWILVLRALGLGDLLTAVPALRAIADAFPRRRVVLACPDGLAQLALLTGAVDEVTPANPLEPLRPFRSPPDVAVNLHGRGPESHRIVLATRPRRLIGFANEAVPETRLLPRWLAGEHEVERWCRLLRGCGIPADPRRLGLSRPSVRSPVPAGVTVIHPGASSGARRWPPERFGAVARAELDAGRRVVVTGSSAERRLAERVARLARLPADAVLAGRTALLELAALVAAAGRVVCGDTGIAHLATAFGTPSVVLFGPTPPSSWGPPRDRAHLHRSLWAGVEGDPHRDPPSRGLLRIQVDDVLRELQILDEADPPDRSRRDPIAPGGS